MVSDFKFSLGRTRSPVIFVKFGMAVGLSVAAALFFYFPGSVQGRSCNGVETFNCGIEDAFGS